MAAITYELIRKDETTGARAGVIHTPHGSFPTPIFMPVGTQATVKGVSPDELRELGAGIILSNTYHLFLRPGMELVREAGGLHRFMHWGGAILTDSGGFQVFSLGDLRKITEEGATFRSHIDGSKKFLSPEVSMEVQKALGSDIVMAFDECIPYPADHTYAKASTERTQRWLVRCRDAMADAEGQGLFGIVQGGMYRDLRAWHAAEMTALDLPGYAIGGLSVGEPHELMEEILSYTVELLPQDKPRYLMGVGTPDYLLTGVRHGIDMFDCVLPTRNARNGSYFTHDGMLSIKQERFSHDFSPIDAECTCKVCRTYSRAYLRHLFKEQEILSAMLSSYHNLYFLHAMMGEIRNAIEENRFLEYKRDFLARFGAGNSR